MVLQSIQVNLEANSLDRDTENVFVKGSCEIALQQFVVKDGLGDDAADKLEITQMV